MNPRQRRGILLMVMAAVAALVVFFALSTYVANVNSQVGSMVKVYKASSDLPAYTALGVTQVEEVQIPKRWAAETTVDSIGDLQGRKVGFNVKQGTILTSDMLVPPSDLSPTEREIAINVDAVTGVAGRVATGDYVDIYAVFADVQGLPKQVRVLVRNVRVVSVGGEQTVRANDADREEKDIVPVTLALEPDSALAVTYAGAFAAEVRLVKLPTGNTQNRTNESDEYDADQLGGTAVPETGQ